jgi:hypothetical protein
MASQIKDMASQQEVKQYLAYWFQLGKRVITHNGTRVQKPQPVIRGNRYSQEFEECWSLILSPESKDCYLEGTSQTIDDLLEPGWQINPCARCGMPVPIPIAAMPSGDCPCFDLQNWPNSEIPQPRAPVDTQTHLTQLRERLQAWKPKSADHQDGEERVQAS